MIRIVEGVLGDRFCWSARGGIVICLASCSRRSGAATPVATALNTVVKLSLAAAAAAKPELTVNRMSTDTANGNGPGSPFRLQGHPPVRRIAPENSKPSTANAPNRPHSAACHVDIVRTLPDRGDQSIYPFGCSPGWRQSRASAPTRWTVSPPDLATPVADDKNFTSRSPQTISE